MPSCGIAILVRLRSPPAPMDGTPVWQATRPETYQEEVSDLQLFAFCEWLNALPLLLAASFVAFPRRSRVHGQKRDGSHAWRSCLKAIMRPAMLSGQFRPCIVH